MACNNALEVVNSALFKRATKISAGWVETLELAAMIVTQVGPDDDVSEDGPPGVWQDPPAGGMAHGIVCILPWPYQTPRLVPSIDCIQIECPHRVWYLWGLGVAVLRVPMDKSLNRTLLTYLRPPA